VIPEAETFFPMPGTAIRVMGPGEPNATYGWETEQEGFQKELPDD
jgi:hypothetical protein